MLALPREQRQSLALHLLLGYDAPLAAHIAGGSPEEERSRLSTALQRLARPAGVPLPYESQSDECPTIRRRISELAEQRHSEADTRAHLAVCSACRTFERAWTELNHMVEAHLRQVLRDRSLPAPLTQELLRLVRPPERWHNRTLLRFGLLLGAVALVLAYLVLPGFLRPPPEDETPLATNAPPADPRALVQQALATSDLTPGQNNGIWHGVWEIFWYFGDGTYAPLRAEAWIDGRNPARHRLQLSHSSGGAPYELQLGDGQGQIWYALDPLYQPSLYGSNIIRMPANRPDLAQWAMNPSDQELARRARLASGAWDLGAAYLRQATAAANLRTLGRQRESGHTVQIVSFSGTSPLEVPPDASGNPGPTTILLAIDIDDGRLRRVTELVGPRGGSQTSRVTWRLREESWLATASQINAAFDISQAWNGRGRFDAEPARDQAADLNLLLLGGNNALLSPMYLLNGFPFQLPAVPPPGAERMLLRQCDWTGQDTCPTGPFGGAIYFGPGRWLTLTTIPWTRATGSETLQLDDWDVSMQAGKGSSYRIALATRGASTTNRQYSFTVEGMLLESRGYSRAELLAVLNSLKPFDGESLRAHLPLLVPTTNDGAARRAMLEALAVPRPPAPGELLTWRERSYGRQNPQIAMPTDPYSPPPYSGLPETTLSEQWMSNNGVGAGETVIVQQAGASWFSTLEDYTTFVRTSNEQGQPLQTRYEGPERAWTFDQQNSVLQSWPWQGNINRGAAFTDGDFRLWGILQPPTSAVSLTMQTLPNGTRIVTATEMVADPNGRWNNLTGTGHADEWPSIRDLRPVQMLTEFTLPPNGRVSAVRTYAVPAIPEFQVTIDGKALPESSVTVTNDVLSFTLPNGDQVQMPRGTFTNDSGEIRFTHGNTHMVNVRYRTATSPGTPILVRSWELLEERRSTLADAPPELSSGTLPQALVVLNWNSAASQPRAVYNPQPQLLQQRLEGKTYSVFLPTPASDMQLVSLNDLGSVGGMNDLFHTALRAGVADRYSYLWTSAGSNHTMSFIQGSAEKLRAFIRSHWNTPWSSSQQRRLTIAGQEVDAWLMDNTSNSAGTGWLFAEVDGTLIVVEAPRTFFNDSGLAILASMRRTN